MSHQNADPFHSTGLILLLALASGLVVGNLYYAQPLVGPISASLRFAPGTNGLIVTCTQLGYSAGLLLIVPLADLVENRRLIQMLLCLATAALVVAATAGSALVFLLAAFAIGVGSVAVQVLVPYAAHFSAEAVRGRAVGNVMSGLLLGIMLARPIASVVTQYFGWHAIYYASSVVMLATLGLISAQLPRRQPRSGLRYGALLASMKALALGNPVLQRRASYHTLLFASFSLFWTTVPLRLASPEFGLSQGEIALFALAGVTGAIAAPFAGHAADRGHTARATVLAIVSVALAYLITLIPGIPTLAALAMLVCAAILIDLGVSANLILGQRAIFALGAEIRSRLNSLYMTSFFLGGALGSALGGWIYAIRGWSSNASVGMMFPVLALLLFIWNERASFLKKR